MRAGRRPPSGRRQARPADGADPRRGGEHLPHRRPARPLQPSRLPGHGAGHDPAVLPAGRDRLGRAGHGRPVGRGHPEGDRRGDRRPAAGPRPGHPGRPARRAGPLAPATATAARASRSPCAGRTSSKPPTSAPCRRARRCCSPPAPGRPDPAAALVRRPGRRRISAANAQAEDAMRRAAPDEPPSQAADLAVRPTASPPGRRPRHDRASPAPAAGREDPPPQPVYSSVEDWVTGQFLPMFRRPLGGEYRWCAAMVAARRGHHPAHRPVALLGSAAPGARHRHGHLAPRPSRPPAPRSARQERAVRAVQRRRAHRPPAGTDRAATARMVGPGAAPPRPPRRP